jgi:hypothetical protein
VAGKVGEATAVVFTEVVSVRRGTGLCAAIISDGTIVRVVAGAVIVSVGPGLIVASLVCLIATVSNGIMVISGVAVANTVELAVIVAVGVPAWIPAPFLR